MVANQNEYTLPVATSSEPGLSNIVRVEVNYTGATNGWKKARPISMKALEQSMDKYLTNQPTSDPIYIVFDTGVQIFPQPTTGVSGGLRLYGTYDVVELALTPSPSVPVIQKKWHDLIALGMESYIWKSW